MNTKVKPSIHPVPGALEEALKKYVFPPLPGSLVHIINYPTYVHVSKTDPKLWSWTPSLRHLAQDRQVRTTPGKILKQVTNLPDHEIRDLVAEYQVWVSKTYPQYTLQWATTEEDVVSVYQNLAPDDMENARGEGREAGEPLEDVVAVDSNYSSCMGHATSSYGRVHPASIYGRSPDGSIAVAYIEDELGIVARVVCSMKAKTYVRLYQRYKSDGATHLEALLEELNFEASNYLEGKVRARWKYDEETLYMPYLDGDTEFDVDGDFVYFSRSGEYSCTETSGYVDLEVERHTCDHCGDNVGEDDLTWVDRAQESVCNHCLENDFVYAYTGRYQEYVYESDVTECQDNGEYYTEGGIEYHDLVYDREGDLRERDNVTWIESLGEYVDTDDTFEDGDGEVRHYSEVDFTWWILDGDLYEYDPGDAIQVGTWIYTNLWFTKQDLWHDKLHKAVGDYDVVNHLMRKIKEAVVRWERWDVPGIQEHGRWRGFYTVNPELWIANAKKFDVEFDERGNPIVEGQLALEL